VIAGGGVSAPSKEMSGKLAGIRETLSQRELDSFARQESPEERIRVLASAARQLSEKAKQKFLVLKQLPPGAPLREKEHEQAKEIAEFVLRVDDESKKALLELGKIRNTGQVPADAVTELDDTESAYRSLASEPGRFRKRLAKLDLTSPDSEAREPGLASGIHSLRAAMNRLDAHIDHVFAQARKTFEPYGPAESQPMAIQALRRTVQSRQALILYSYGRRRPAKRLWLAMSNEDRLDPRPLHNIAVCNSIEGDHDRVLTAWKAYAEAEYFQAVALGTPRSGAPARAMLHAELGATLGPAALRAEQHPNQLKAQPADIASFLSSSARVRGFVDHQILHFWNSRLDFASPPIGTRRSSY